MTENNKPKVSVIMPCFNVVDYIEEAINSVIKQTYLNIELIIVNDGSTNLMVKKKLDTLRNEMIKVIHLEKNLGVNNARNIAVESAKGKYILPLDSDDYIDKNYIEKAVVIMEGDKRVGLVYPNVKLVGLENRIWQLPKYKFPEIIVNNTIVNSSMYKRSDWQSVKGDKKNMKYCWEDYDFWLSLIELGVKVVNIPEVMLYYRIRNESISSASNDKEKMKYTRLQLVRNHPKLYRENTEMLMECINELDFEVREYREYKNVTKRLNREIAEMKQIIFSKDMEMKRIIQGKNGEIELWKDEAARLRIKNRLKRLIHKLIPFKRGIFKKYRK